jgi:SEC-C motif-containing protein
MLDQICPCGTDKHYKNCCGMYHTKEQYPSTPEELMRSRYTAFVMKDMAYIQTTMRGPALAQFKKQGTNVSNNEEWLGLKVINAYYDNANTNIGYVEFIAKYKLYDKEIQIHELSKFQREDNRWYYVDGKHLQ